MTPQSLASMAESGLLGLMLALILAPFVIVWCLWRLVTRLDY